MNSLFTQVFKYTTRDVDLFTLEQNSDIVVKNFFGLRLFGIIWHGYFYILRSNFYFPVL